MEAGYIHTLDLVQLMLGKEAVNVSDIENIPLANARPDVETSLMQKDVIDRTFGEIWTKYFCADCRATISCGWAFENIARPNFKFCPYCGARFRAGEA